MMDMGDPTDPPRFSCEKCGGEMLPVYYTSLHGITYKNPELKSITKRSYVVAEVYMMNGKRFNIIEVEREHRPLSTIVLSSNSEQNWGSIYNYLLVGLVNACGTWNSKFLKSIEAKGIDVAKAKHSSKGIRRRAKSLLSKFYDQ